MVGTTRWNSAFAYIDPVRRSAGLRIVDVTMVDRVESTPGGVFVRAVRHGEALRIEAGLVVLAAGVYGTPAILQRSGVGDADRLAELDVEVVHHSPGVGANLHDHSMVHADRRIGPELQRHLDVASEAGFLPEEQTLGKALSSLAHDGIFDLHLFPVCASTQTSLISERVAVEVACMTPMSRGRVDITSAHPDAPLIIDHAYLTDPDDHDITVLRDGLVMANQILDHPIVAALVGDPITDVSTDEAIRANVAHYYHPVGTCAMGNDANSVCDPVGRVRGLPNVVVADASLMPRIMRANTNIPSVAIGEKIAALLLGS